MNYTIEYNPFDSVLGRMGSSIGQGFANSISQQVQSEQNGKTAMNPVTHFAHANGVPSESLSKAV